VSLFTATNRGQFGNWTPPVCNQRWRHLSVTLSPVHTGDYSTIGFLSDSNALGLNNRPFS